MIFFTELEGREKNKRKKKHEAKEARRQFLDYSTAAPELKSKEQSNNGRRKTSKGEKLFLETPFRSSSL